MIKMIPTISKTQQHPPTTATIGPVESPPLPMVALVVLRFTCLLPSPLGCALFYTGLGKVQLSPMAVQTRNKKWTHAHRQGGGWSVVLGNARE